MWLFCCNPSMGFPLLFLRAWFSPKLRIEAEKERFRFSIAARSDPTSNTATTACKFNVRDWLGYVDCNLGRFRESAPNFKWPSLEANEIKRNLYWKGNTLHTFNPLVLLPVHLCESPRFGIGLLNVTRIEINYFYVYWKECNIIFPSREDKTAAKHQGNQMSLLQNQALIQIISQLFLCFPSMPSLATWRNFHEGLGS